MNEDLIKALTGYSMAVTAIAELVAVGAPKDAILNDLKSLDIAISDRRNVLVEAAVK